MEKTLTPEQLRQKLAGGTPPLILDVRRAEDKAAGPEGIAGSQWRDPAKLSEWAEQIPVGGEVALFCVRGGAVSKSVQETLEARGVTARYIEGGLTAWDAEQALWNDPDVEFLRGLGVSEPGVQHCVRVASLALWVAGQLDPAKSGPVDLDLVRRGGLLHDAGKVNDLTNLHGVAGAELCRTMGVPEPVLAVIEKHVRHGAPLDQAVGYGLPERDFSFTRVEERIVSYADKLADVLAANLAATTAEAHASLPKILEDRPGLAKDEATQGRYLASRELFLSWAKG
jgi:uncharacterized protein